MNKTNSPPTIEEAMTAFEKWFKENPNGGIFEYQGLKFKIEKK